MTSPLTTPKIKTIMLLNNIKKSKGIKLSKFIKISLIEIPIKISILITNIINIFITNTIIDN